MLDDNDFNDVALHSDHEPFTNMQDANYYKHDKPTNCASFLTEMKTEHSQQETQSLYIDQNQLNINIKLLHILKRAKAPLYLFDQIVDWAQDAVNQYDVDFGNHSILSRTKTIDHLKIKYNLKNVEPQVKRIHLPGSNKEIELVTHSF